MKPMPIKWRIGLLVAGVLLIVIIALSCVAYHEMEDSLEGYMDQTLWAMSNSIRTSFDDDDSLAELDKEIRATAEHSSRGLISEYRIWLDGSLKNSISSTDTSADEPIWLAQVMGEPPPQPGKPRFVNLVHNGRFRAIWARYETNRGLLNVLILRSSEHSYHELQEYFNFLLVLGGSIVVGSVIAVVGLVLWAMKPLGQTAEKLHSITYQNLGTANLSELKPPAELRPFIDAVGELLSRLDEAIQGQRQFTSDASHELRTPLSAAKSTLEAICMKDRTPAEYRQAIRETIDDLDRIEQLTAQLLLLARMDVAGQVPGAAEVRLDVLVQQLAEVFGARAAQAGGSVTYEDKTATYVYGNEQYLSHLFGNLLDNAIKHGPRGRPVQVSIRHDSAKQCTVCIHDEGGGIPVESLSHLFDRFYRADSSRSRSSGGSGLGLAIARKIARLHGGDIEINSTPADGTDVLVHLPRLAGNS
ncbi:MAG: hypothetical protein GWP14_05220 [Actinobacteria bacterium]|nr:hypothetical protein [Actinomycetota bacterium]